MSIVEEKSVIEENHVEERKKVNYHHCFVIEIITYITFII